MAPTTESSGDPFPGARLIRDSGTCADCGQAVYAGDIHYCGQPAPKPISGKKMCELIAEVHHRRTGETLDPESIWNANPTGELDHVWALYTEALAWRNTNVDPREDR